MWIIDNGNYEAQSLKAFVADYVKGLRDNCPDDGRLQIKNAYWSSNDGQEVFVSQLGIDQINDELEALYNEFCESCLDQGARRKDGVWLWK